jgi:hypothetical protein
MRNQIRSVFILVLFLGLSFWSRSASAMLTPQLGRFLQQDPLGYVDSMSRYQYERSNSIRRGDPDGLQTQPCGTCGPDVTNALLRFILKASLRIQSSEKPGYAWAWQHGMEMDWRVGPTGGCPSDKNCERAYTLCGECVHDHWIGNFLFAYILSLSDFSRDRIFWAGDHVQGPGPGDPAVDPATRLPIKYLDPPWDTAGYDIGIDMANTMKDSSKPTPSNSSSLCGILKSNPALWTASNDTSPKLSAAITTSKFGLFSQTHIYRYPTPLTTGQTNCKPCDKEWNGNLHSVGGIP